MKLLARKWQIIIFTTLLITSVVFFVSVIIPPTYVSQADILISCRTAQKQTLCSSQAANYIAQVYSEIIHSQPFLAEVEDRVALSIFDRAPKDPGKAKTYWQEKIVSEVKGDTGILSISIYAESRKEAEALLQAISKKISDNGNKMFAEIDSVEASVISGPISPLMPVSPNVLKNTLIAFVSALLLSFLYVLISKTSDEEKVSIPSNSLKWKRPDMKSAAPRNYDMSGKRPFSIREESVYKIPEKGPKPAFRQQPSNEQKKTNIPVFMTSQAEKEETARKEKAMREKMLREKESKTEETAFAAQPAQPVEVKKDRAEKEEVKPKFQVPVKEEVRKVGPLEKSQVEKTAAAEIPVFKEKESRSLDKKAVAPDNLPIFESEAVSPWEVPVQEPVKRELAEPEAKETLVSEPVSKPEEAKPTKPEQPADFVPRMNAPEPTQEEKDAARPEKDPTEEEIKKRLNKLLRGEL